MALQAQKSTFPKLDDFQTAFALAQWALSVYQNLPSDSPDRAFFVQYFQNFLTNYTPPKYAPTAGFVTTTPLWGNSTSVAIHGNDNTTLSESSNTVTNGN